MTTVTTSSSVGITLTSPAYVSPVIVDPGITISGPTNAIFAADGPWSIQNAGSLYGDTISGAGIYFQAAGSVTNAASGRIAGAEGISATGNGILFVSNAGDIAGGSVGINNELGGGHLPFGFGFAGYVTNQSMGTITGFDVIVGYGAFTVENAGTLAGNTASGSGVFLLTGGTFLHPGASGGSVINQSGGTISGFDGIGNFGHYGIESVVNAGIIAGNATAGAGISLQISALIANERGGTISGYDGIYDFGLHVAIGPGLNFGSGYLGNGGIITGMGTAGFGVELNGGGTLSNAATGTITGGGFGVRAGTVSAGGRIYTAQTVINAGLIATSTTSGEAIDITGNGIVGNTGTITGGAIGVAIRDGGTVDNTGTIAGAAYAVQFEAGYTNRLVIRPGATFYGTVDGGNTLGATAVSTLEFAAGTASLAQPGLGTQFINFAQIVIDPGSALSVSSLVTIAAGQTLTIESSSVSDTATLIDDGEVVLDPSTLTVANLTGTGSVTIASGSTLSVLGTISTGQTIDFAGTGGELILGNATAAAGTIAGFAAGDTIDLTTLTFVNGATATVNNSILSVTNGTTTDRLTVAGIPDGTSFAVGQDSGGTGTSVVPCFLPGTLILTDRGERPVEALKTGDTVITLRGHRRRLCWIGQGQALAMRGRRGAATPVIVRKGALADNVPHRDLRITKGHSLYLDGVLVPVEFLVNHRSILWDDRAQAVAVFHLELEGHDVLVANGAPAESYRDDGNRFLFRNANSAWDQPAPPPCAPVLTGGPIVDTMWRRLLDRAGPRPSLPLTEDPDLHLLVDGIRMDATIRTDDVHVFELACPPSTVRLASRAAVPQELGFARDPRCLGVAVRRVALRKGTRFQAFTADDQRLKDGFYPVEPETGFRWTDGNAAIPGALFSGYSGTVELVIHVAATSRYVDEGARRHAVA
jgi:hypothetical protein